MAIWTAFIVLGLVLCIDVLVCTVRRASRAIMLKELSVDAYNVYISNQNKCALWQCTEKALNKDKIALKRAINAKKRSGEKIWAVDYSFITHVPEFMRVPEFYHYIKPKCRNIQNWSFTVGHNIKLHCKYYYTEGDKI